MNIKEKDFDDALDLEYNLGQAVTYENLNKKFLEKSGLLFTYGNDHLASEYRELAKEMFKKSSEIRIGLQTKYPKIYPNGRNIKNENK